MRRYVLMLLVAAALAGGGTLVVRRTGPAFCTSEAALDAVHRLLRDQFHVDQIMINDAQTVAGGWLAGGYDCTVEVAEIRGNVNASDLHWRRVQYRSTNRDAAGQPVVSVALQGAVGLAAVQKPFWERVAGYFGG